MCVLSISALVFGRVFRFFFFFFFFFLTSLLSSCSRRYGSGKQQINVKIGPVCLNSTVTGMPNITYVQTEAQEREIQNEKLGSFLIEHISTKLSPLDVRKYLIFVGELDKVVLLQVLLRSRMKVLGENLTEQEKRRKNNSKKQTNSN